MTAREWQHALFFRDRWSADLEADVRSRDAVGVLPDHAPRRRPRPRSARSHHPRGARRRQRQQPAEQRDERRASNNFAPRVGGVYRFNDKTVFRTGYGLTYNAQPWARAVRGDNDYPVTIASTFVNAEQFAYYGTLQQGIPHDCRTRREQRPRAAGSRGRRVHARDRQHRSRLRPHLERRGRTASGVRHRGGRRVRRRQGRRRIRRARHQRSADARRRRREPAVRVARTPRRHQFLGTAVWRRGTTRCRSRSTSRSRTGCCSRARTR